MVAAINTGLVSPARFVGIKRNKGLDDVLNKHKAQGVDKVREVEVIGDDKFAELFEKYEQFLKGRSFGSKSTEILTPEEINLFLQATVVHEEHPSYVIITSLFISKLIQNSYNDGYNDFVLDTELLSSIMGLGYDLNGTEDNPINLTIYGEKVNDCCFNSSYLNLNIEGNVAKFGYYLNNSEVKVYGEVLTLGIIGTNNTTFDIKGKIGCVEEDLVKAGTTYCTFKAYDQESLNVLLRGVPEIHTVETEMDSDSDGVILKDKDFDQDPSYNKIIFVHPDGNEETVRFYNDDYFQD